MLQHSVTLPTVPEHEPAAVTSPGERRSLRDASPFSYPRDFLNNRFVYLTISPRARGLSIGVNVNPDAACSFNCLYCEVDRSRQRTDAAFNCDVASVELMETLALVRNGALRDVPAYRSLPSDFLKLQHVALSGDGEPTESVHFLRAVETVTHIRACATGPFFKLALITNAAHLHQDEVTSALAYFTDRDEIWAKLDAGTQAYMDLVNGSSVPIQRVLDNILALARKRPVTIQSLFSLVDGEPPSRKEIAAYSNRLRELKNAGAKIPLVQIYSATRPMSATRIRHLPLRTMSEIAAQVRRETGIPAQVF